jgi:hypothetical protein
LKADAEARVAWDSLIMRINCLMARFRMPVRNLPNTAKVWEAVQGDVRHGARAPVKSRITWILEITGDAVLTSG